MPQPPLTWDGTNAADHSLLDQTEEILLGLYVSLLWNPAWATRIQPPEPKPTPSAEYPNSSTAGGPGFVGTGTLAVIVVDPCHGSH